MSDELDFSDLSSDTSLLSIKYKNFTVLWPKHPPGRKAFIVSPDALHGAPEIIETIADDIKQDGSHFCDAIRSESSDDKDTKTANTLCDILWDLENLDIHLKKLPNDSLPKLRAWSISLQANLIPSMEAFTTAEDGAGSTLKQWTEGPDPLVASKATAAKLRFLGATERVYFDHEPEDMNMSFIFSDKYERIQAPENGVITYPECPPFSAFSTKGMRADFTDNMHVDADRILAQGIAVSGSIKAYGARHIEQSKISENVTLAATLALRHLREFWDVLKAPTSFPVKRNKALYSWVYQTQKTLEDIFLLPAKQERLLSEKKLSDQMDGGSPAAETRKYYHVL